MSLAFKMFLISFFFCWTFLNFTYSSCELVTRVFLTASREMATMALTITKSTETSLRRVVVKRRTCPVIEKSGPLSCGIGRCMDNVLYQIEWYHVVHGTPDPSSFHCHFWKTAFYSTASSRKRHIIARNTAHIRCTEPAKNSLSIKIYLLRYYPLRKEANRQSVVLRGAKEPPVSDSSRKTETWNYIRQTRFCLLFTLNFQDRWTFYGYYTCIIMLQFYFQLYWSKG